MSSVVVDHIPLLIALAVALSLGLAMLGLSAVLGPRRPSVAKSQAFECGNPSSGGARERFHVKYYLVAILFLVFDIEAVFIYPWALSFREATLGQGGDALVLGLDALVFMAIILVGLAYAWRKGAIEWAEARHE